jgi:hypothetical protein
MSVMQDLYSLNDKTFRGAYKRTREWEDMYLADGDVVEEDDDAALSDDDDGIPDDASADGKEDEEDDANLIG